MTDPATTQRSETSQTPPRRRSTWRGLLLKLAFSIVLFLILFELAAQAMLFKLKRDWKAVKADPAFYYQASPDPVLAYELRKSYTYVHPEHGRVHINQFGLRDDDQGLPAAPRKIALLGDSVTFGVHTDQKQILPARLQELIDPSATKVKVLNFGVPGYAAAECLQFLKDKNAIYHVTDVVYVLNPNDFARRDTRFEGADDGLYRVYHPPLLAAPMMVRKAIYRWNKSHSFTSSTNTMVRPEWYLWMYDGGRDHGFADFQAMKRYADENGIRFRVLLFPLRSAYTANGYALARMCDDLAAFFKAEGVPFLDPKDQFATDTANYINASDHLDPPGAEKMAIILRDFIGISSAATQVATQAATQSTTQAGTSSSR